MATSDEGKFWTTWNYILAALGGTLAATGVVIVVSIALSPAHINFSIVHASSHSTNANSTGDTWFGDYRKRYLNLTIAAANASWKRAAVQYLAIFIDLRNSTSVYAIHTEVYARPPAGKYLQPGAAPAIIKASYFGVYEGDEYNNFVGNPGLTVVVVAQVRFRVAGIQTRVYDIKVSCPGVFLPEEGSSRSHKPPAPPVDCAA